MNEMYSAAFKDTEWALLAAVRLERNSSSFGVVRVTNAEKNKLPFV
jgi:hypothetical protein